MLPLLSWTLMLKRCFEAHSRYISCGNCHRPILSSIDANKRAIQKTFHERRFELECAGQEAVLEATQERDSNLQQHEAQQAEQQQAIEALQAQVGSSRLNGPMQTAPVLSRYFCSVILPLKFPGHKGVAELPHGEAAQIFECGSRVTHTCCPA